MRYSRALSEQPGVRASAPRGKTKKRSPPSGVTSQLLGPAPHNPPQAVRRSSGNDRPAETQLAAVGERRKAEHTSLQGVSSRPSSPRSTPSTMPGFPGAGSAAPRGPEASPPLPSGLLSTLASLYCPIPSVAGGFCAFHFNCLIQIKLCFP